MDKEQLLASGLLEQYVLGLTTDEESHMVEALAAEHEEIRRELALLQQTMERYTAQHKAPATDTFFAAPQSKSNMGLRKLSEKALWPLATAFALAWGVYGALKTDFQHQLVLDWQNKFAMLEQDCQKKQHSIQTLADHSAFIQHRHTNKVILNGIAMCQGHFAIAYWNPAAEKCYLDMGSLPPAPKGKTYQVWADVDGKMVNAGTVHCGQTGHLQEITYFPNTASLNITLEPEGGSHEPTVSLLQANGLLASN